MEASFSYEDLGKKSERKVFFNPEGLSKDEQNIVGEVSKKVIEESKNIFKYSLNRCTFFVEPRLKVLEEIMPETPEIQGPEIRGCDNNPFDQHYWVEFTLKNDMRKIVIDPIFGYVGLLSEALVTEEGEYYKHSRHVIPNKHVSEGGVRINTNGVM